MSFASLPPNREEKKPLDSVFGGWLFLARRSRALTGFSSSFFFSSLDEAENGLIVWTTRLNNAFLHPRRFVDDFGFCHEIIRFF